MKKILLLACLAVLSAGQLQAQSLFETVYKQAIAKVNDGQSSQETLDINQFEVTALNYLTSQVKTRGLKKDSYFYDSQAVNLKSFVDDFLFYVNKARSVSAQKRKQVIECYRNASLQNPLFNDEDKQKVWCYVNDVQTYTPFSLDTDWEKAYDQATQQVKTIIK